MAYNVPFVNYPEHYRRIWNEVMEAITEVLSGGDLILRDQLMQFEENIASFVGVKHGVGVNLMNDKLGFSNDFIFSASYAFRMDVGNGNLGIGVNVGMANPSIEPEWNGADVIDPASDPAIPTGGSGFGLDMGVGIYYNTESMYNRRR